MLKESLGNKPGSFVCLHTCTHVWQANESMAIVGAETASKTQGWHIGLTTLEV